MSQTPSDEGGRLQHRPSSRMIDGRYRSGRSCRSVHLVQADVGQTRDLQLIDKLTRFSQPGQPPDDEAVDSRQGVNFGDGTRPAPEYEGKRMFKPELAGTREPWLFHESDLPVVTNVRVPTRGSRQASRRSPTAAHFKHSWTRATGRFRAWLSVSENGTGALCNQSFVSVHAAAQVLRRPPSRTTAESPSTTTFSPAVVSPPTALNWPSAKYWACRFRIWPPACSTD